MATKNRTKRQTAKSPRNLKRSGPLTPAKAMKIAQAVIDASAARSLEPTKPRGVRLTERQASAATGELSEVNISLVSMVEIARSCVNLGIDPAPAMIAIEAICKVGCRKLDAVARLLGDGGFGNFDRELSGTAESLTAEA